MSGPFKTKRMGNKKYAVLGPDGLPWDTFDGSPLAKTVVILLNRAHQMAFRQGLFTGKYPKGKKPKELACNHCSNTTTDVRAEVIGSACPVCTVGRMDIPDDG